MKLTDEQVENLKEAYKKYYENYTFLKKEYIRSARKKNDPKHTTPFLGYAKGLEVVCALDDIYNILGIRTDIIERSVDHENFIR